MDLIKIRYKVKDILLYDSPEDNAYIVETSESRIKSADIREAVVCFAGTVEDMLIKNITKSINNGGLKNGMD